MAGPDGRVEIRYKPTDTRAYRAGKRNLAPSASGELLPDDACVAAAAPAPTAATRRDHAAAAAMSRVHAPEAIVVYADGACSGNPGPAGLGVVVVDGRARRELSLYLGEATNNVAELTAIIEAAKGITDPARPVRIHTDSRYSIGVLSLGWKAKKNQALVAQAKQALSRFSDLQLIHVPGHAGVPLNERADELAVQAVRERASSGWQTC